MSEGIAHANTAQRLERLLEISRNLASTLDLPQLLQKIIQVACELTDSQEASILLYDRTSGDLRFQAVADHQRTDLLNVSVPLETSAAGLVFTKVKPIVIQDATNDPRIYRQIDQKLNFRTQSLLGVPLIVEQEPIGVLEAVNKKSDGNYTEDDLAILETLASQASIAIHNASLLNKLREANTNLRNLDRMKSDFIAIASHELRTPLGLILGHATFLKDTVEDELRDQMEVIIRSAMRLKTIVEDLSAIAHKEEGASRVRLEEFAISSLVEEVVGRYQDFATEKKIHLSFDVPENDPLTISGEREKIDVALSNLVQNAITFTDPNGQIGVKAEKAGDKIKVFVVDTGIGIPEKDIERIFDRFYQVESHLTRKHGGMGLGLSITRAMVELHAGEIWCESKEGTGSLFCFTLPISSPLDSAASKVFTTY
ncbi:MAG: GAF domain-containing protein [Anaerolineales bacterium]|nr:GAF domain-containing protein [Anaerolineales bacterium]